MLKLWAVWSVPWNISFSDFRVELFAWNTNKTNSLWLLFHIIMSPKHWCKCMSLCLCSSAMSWAPAGDQIPSAESFLSFLLSPSVILNLKWSYIYSKWITLKMHSRLALLHHLHQNCIICLPFPNRLCSPLWNPLLPPAPPV